MPSKDRHRNQRAITTPVDIITHYIRTPQKIVTISQRIARTPD